MLLKCINILYNYSKLLFNTSYIYYNNIDISNNEEWIDKLSNNIKKSGAVSIKFIQWILPIIKVRYPNILLTKKFQCFFSDCNIHDIEYTKKIYKKNFKKDLENDYNIIKIIGSGSIGQVYLIEDKINKKKFALKVIHPNIDIELNIFIFIYKISKLIIDLKKIIPTNNFDKFISKLKDQHNLTIEADYNNKFSKIFYDNDYIIIPKIHENYKDIYLMEYIEGDTFHHGLSSIKQSKSLTLLAIFLENSCLNNIVHGDLHEGNWSIKNIDDDCPKIIIYDFGFCYEISDIEYKNVMPMLLRKDKLNETKKLLEYYLNKEYNKKINKKIILEKYIHDPIFDKFYSCKKNNELISLVDFLPSLLKYVLNNNIQISYTCINSMVLWLQLTSYFGGSRCRGENGHETGIYDYHEYNSNLISICKKNNICKNLVKSKEKEIMNYDGKFTTIDFSKFDNIKKFI